MGAFDDGSYETLRKGARYRLGCGPSGYVIQDLLGAGQPVVEHYPSDLLDVALLRFAQLEETVPPLPGYPPPGGYPPPSGYPPPGGHPPHPAFGHPHPASPAVAGGWVAPHGGGEGAATGPWEPAGPVASCCWCGAGLPPGASVCVGCGTPARSARDKGVAVVLAVVLSFWTWLYTYRLDKKKFWAGLGLDALGVVLLTAGVGWAMLVGVWAWSVVAAATRPAELYARYPAGPDRP